ncbi:unnamed protein product [Calypogeia fissa]
MTPWELTNCPWYIETDRWTTPFNPLEVSSLRAIEKGRLPASLQSEAKLQSDGDSDESFKKVESNMMKYVPRKDKGQKSRKLELLAPKKLKKASQEASQLTLRASRKRKLTDSGSDLSAAPSPSAGVGAASGFDYDLGSVKKLRVRRKALDHLLEEEDNDDDEFDEFARNGIVRKSAFRSESDRHLFVKSSVKSLTEELSVKKQKPEWMKKYDSWVKHILSLKLCRFAPKVCGKTVKGPFVDMGFIFLPNGLRAHVEDKQVLDWNMWDDSIPVNFFCFMDKFLADNGFLVVLHSEEFEHIRKVRDAADASSRFKYVYHFQVLLPTPMFREHQDVQVQILSLSIFCRTAHESRLSKDSNFVPVYSGEDLRYTSLLTLCLSKDRNPAFEFAGSTRMSVGFVQRIIEYLTKPGDVVIDWTTGEGASFYAGDYCGRHVIGLEDRPIFDTTAEVSMASASLERVFEKEVVAPVGDAGAGPSGSKEPQKRDLFDIFDQAWLNDPVGKAEGEEEEDESDQEDGPAGVWRSEQRFLLRKKVIEAESLISPEKAFILPAYAERHARIIDSSARLLRWESKGIRSRRGPDGKFLSSRFVDDRAAVSQYMDLSAESTTATESSDVSSCDSDSSSGSGSSRSGGPDPPLDFVSFPL